jgi:LPXTG-motif cell wall-anchored protein
MLAAALHNDRSKDMDNVTLIRMIAGVLALVVLGVIIWRRKRQSID